MPELINLTTQPSRCEPWNKGKLIGAKPPLRPKHVWSIRAKLQMAGQTRDLAMFNLAIDSKLRRCDVVGLKVDDVASSWSRGRSRNGTPEEDRPAGQVRNDGVRPERRSTIISEPPIRSRASFCSTAVEDVTCQSRHDSTLDWSASGLLQLGCTLAFLGHIHSAEPTRR
jgi:hypothetical protein